MIMFGVLLFDKYIKLGKSSPMFIKYDKRYTMLVVFLKAKIASICDQCNVKIYMYMIFS